MAGRLTKRTDKTRAEILKALRAGNTRTAAAEYVGVSRVNLWRWMVADATFRNEVEQAEAQAEVYCATILRQEIGKGDAATARWWLERRRHQDWGLRVQIDLAGLVAQLAQQAGLDAQQTAAAVAEAERHLKELQSGSRNARA